LLGPPGGAPPPAWFTALAADELRVHQGATSTVIVLARKPAAPPTPSSAHAGGAGEKGGAVGGAGGGAGRDGAAGGAWARGAWLRLCGHSLAPLALLLQHSASLDAVCVQTLVPGLGLLAHDCPTAAVPFGFGGGDRAASAIAAAAAAGSSAATMHENGTPLSSAFAASSSSAASSSIAASSGVAAAPFAGRLGASAAEPAFPRAHIELDLTFEAAKTALGRAACPAPAGHRPWGVKLRVNDATGAELPW
jgi:hypothetical protein